MRTVAFICCGLMLGACARRTMPVQSRVSDSVRVEYRTEYIERLRTDTVFVEVPAQSDRNRTTDSVSHLETDFARSDARINPDGSLYHDLHNKPQKRAADVRVSDTERVSVRDSIVYRDRVEEIPVPMPLSKWQQFWIRSGRIAWGCIGIIVFVFFARKIRSIVG